MSYLIPSYWKSVNIGDPKLLPFFQETPRHGWIVEEKVDGSQFSFAVYNGKLYMRSKGKQIDPLNPEKMFSKTVNGVLSLFADKQLPDNTIFRGESVTSKKHNTLTYSRVPNYNFVVFGAECAITGRVYSRGDIQNHLLPPGLEITPLLLTHGGPGSDLLDKVHDLLSTESFLGGALVEGVVIKRVGEQVYFMDRPIFAKLVSEQFREQHKMAWRELNPGKEDVIQGLVAALSGPARYAKAAQNLRDQGVLEGSVRDIGNIIQEVKRNVVEEGEDFAKEILWNWAKDKVARAAGSGVPQWWKDKLTADLSRQLKENE